MLKELLNKLIGRFFGPTPTWLHGFDLNYWNYIGYTEVFWVKDSGDRFGYPIFFFEHKTKKLRNISHPKSHMTKTHGWVVTSGEEWKAFQKTHFQVVTYPSQYFIDHMKETMGYIWFPEERLWKHTSTIPNQKYNDAVKKQTEKKNNVVSLKVIENGTSVQNKT